MSLLKIKEASKLDYLLFHLVSVVLTHAVKKNKFMAFDCETLIRSLNLSKALFTAIIFDHGIALTSSSIDS